MIIGLSGRKGSGKSLLSEELIKRGFVKIGFADKLKELTSSLFDWELSSLYDPWSKEKVLSKPVIWNKTKSEKLEEMIDCKASLYREDKSFFTRRDALQYIGTEVLRKYENDFHINSVRLKIENNPDENFVLDDVRFPNELELLKNMGAKCVFVIRPYFFDNYSNHASETSLGRKDFDVSILNDGSKERVIKEFNMFIDGDNSFLCRYLGDFNDTVDEFTSNHNVFIDINEETSYWAGILSVGNVIHKNGTNMWLEFYNDKELVSRFEKFIQSYNLVYDIITNNREEKVCLKITCPFMIDDLKLWNIEPEKNWCDKIPDCIKDNAELVRCWTMGLIDGIGCIYNNK